MCKNKYEDTLIELYQNYDLEKCKVQLIQQKIFVCGGIVDIKEVTPISFRGYFFEESASSEPQLESLLIMAEYFKDYFKDNIYTDLLEFEDDIAHISSLIVIFLESPGSLVELGLFVNKLELYNKLLIVVPNNESKDSFIYLGPLTHIKKQKNEFVVFYPFPKVNEKFDKNNVKDLISHIKSLLSKFGKTKKVNPKNKTHIIFLICEIVRLSYPITLTEIELCLMGLSIDDYSRNVVQRFLYLLEKFEYIESYDYSSYKFYYPNKKHKNNCFVKFGTKIGMQFDESKHRISLRSTYIDDSSDASRKRSTAMKNIMEKLADESE
ncbi:retron St85 family effector protein [Exercitatus varius]|uniref:retron St85 family effector protein n=1 Tax=Exercitatus varius TaxID=67857 RepID=UPI00294B3D0D|nr:retron St85 family effector protein [Exercitatus varius]MDG2958960.1 retron St85 family effector protein [Exercitatus varius]